MRGRTPTARGPLERLVGRLAAHGDDPNVALRARVLLIYASFVVGLSLIWGLDYLSRGSLGVGLFYVGVAPLLAAAVAVAWRRGQLDLACHLAVLVGLAWITIATYFTGGLRLTNVCPYFGLMVAPVFLLGRPGYLWTALTMTVVAVFETAMWLGYPFPDVVPVADRRLDALMTMVSSAFVLVVFTVSYDEARRRTAERLRAAMATKNRVLTNISHEIRTPLHAMMGVNRVLAAQLTAPDQLKLLATSQENAESLLALFEDLLDLARIDHGRFVLAPCDFDLVELADSVVQVMRHLGGEKGLQVSLDMAPEVPRRVRADRRRLRQVLVNLGGNAVKFTDRGEVRLQIDSVAPAGAVRFAIVDTGVGIAEADRNRLFKSFSQLDGSLSRRHDGVGLGLVIARDLVRSLGGEITVESQVGVGSSFGFTLPLAPARDRSTPPPPVAVRVGRRVLLVEDIAINRELARTMLAASGYEVCEAVSGAEGLAHFEAWAPDLVLMDLQMPGMDGFEATRRIRELEAQRQQTPVAIIAMTGHASDADRDACLAAGMTACLFKPFSATELAALVGRYLCGSEPVDGPTSPRKTV